MLSMNSLWQTLTLSTLSLQNWRQASLLHHLVGLLQTWRKGSRLMQWADWIGAGLVSLVFALAPFVPNALTGVLLAACGGFWLLLTLSDEGKEQGNTPIHLLVLLFWAVMLVATALSPVKQAAFAGLVKLSLYLFLFALAARVLRSSRLRSWIITLYLHVALIVSVYGLQQWFSGTSALATWVDPDSPLARTTRVYSYLGNPNLLAGYLVPAVIFSILAVFAWKGWMPKLLAVTMTIVNGACLVLTFSRGGWIGLVVALFALLVLAGSWWSGYLPKFWRTWALPLMLGGFIGFLALAVVVVEPLRDRVSSIFAGRGDSSNNFRINVWLSVIEMIKDHPIIGIGPGNQAFNKIYPTYQRTRFSALSAYSIVLEVLVEAGIIGLASFLWLLLVVFTQGWNRLQVLRETNDQEAYWLIAALATLVGMLTHGLFDTVLYRPEINTLWWLMIAMIASYYRDRPLPEND